MSLPSADIEFLKDRDLAHSVCTESGMICVVLPAFALPEGCNVAASDLLVRLTPGFPDLPPDMWWFDPPVTLKSGAAIQATEVRETYVGRVWQRWSRHLKAGQWRSGIDRLENYVALIRAEVARCCGGAIS